MPLAQALERDVPDKPAEQEDPDWPEPPVPEDEEEATSIAEDEEEATSIAESSPRSPVTVAAEPMATVDEAVATEPTATVAAADKAKAMWISAVWSFGMRYLDISYLKKMTIRFDM